MKSQILPACLIGTAMILTGVSSLAAKHSSAPALGSTVSPVGGDVGVDTVVCTQHTTLSVRAESLREILFTVERFEPVRVFQGSGWGENKRVIRRNGRRITFVKAQFINHSQQEDEGIGWVARSYLRSRSECPGAADGELSVVPATADSNAHENTNSQVSANALPNLPPNAQTTASNSTPTARTASLPSGSGSKTDSAQRRISGLNDSSCCNFPLQQPPNLGFRQPPRSFGAGRQGRLHAACDLYNERNVPVQAVADGTVILAHYAFYRGTYAVEVRHSGGFVVRYGELTGKVPRGIRTGSKVEKGQTVGYMGKINSARNVPPMLHFELYRGTARGSLTGGGRFQRRSDLLNPTNYLEKWEAEKFFKPIRAEGA